MRATIISYVSIDTKASAERAAEHLRKRQWKVEVFSKSHAGQFRHGGNHQKAIERYLLAIHIAHGKPKSFQVARGKERLVRLRELSPGSRKVRYLWLVSCNVLEHGASGGLRPETLGAGDLNVFDRWGKTYPSRPRLSPLRNGIRLVCGGSSFITSHDTILLPVFQLIDRNFMISDSFILGLANEGQTPLCITRSGEDVKSSGLYDNAWVKEKNEGGEFVYIQYPVVSMADPEGPLERALDLFQSGSRNLSESPSESPNELPSKLPILKVRFDQVSREELYKIVGGIKSKFGFQDSKSDSWALKFYDEEDSGDLKKELGRILTMPLRDLSGDTEIETEFFFRKIVLQIDGMSLRTRVSTRRIEKCSYFVRMNRILMRGFEITILDPDFGAIARCEHGADPPVGDYSLAGLNLSGNSRAVARSGEDIQLINSREAVSLASQILDGSGIEDQIDRDFEKAKVALGYRRYDSADDSLGELWPHYVVTFPYREKHSGVPVEVPAFDQCQYRSRRLRVRN